jgi:hypothetical protein
VYLIHVAKGVMRRAGALEWMLGAALLGLVLQAFPETSSRLWRGFVDVLDFRQWPWLGGVLANCALIMLLVGLRFLPEIRASLSARAARAHRRVGRVPEESDTSIDKDLRARSLRDAEWAGRAKNRLPFS